MLSLLYFLNDAAYDAMPYAAICLGFLLTAKFLRMADVTSSGAFVLGGAIAAILTVNAGANPWLAVVAATLAGAAAGGITAFFHTVLHIDKLLAGILCAFGLFSLNTMLVTPTIAFGDTPTPLSHFEAFDRSIEAGGGGWHLAVIVVMFAAVLSIKLFLDRFLDSETGLALRALEDEEAGEGSLLRQGLSPDRYKIAALCIGNAIIAFSGALVSFKEGAANAQRGWDVLLTGLTAYLVGQQSLGVVRWALSKLHLTAILVRDTTGAILGGIVFFFLITLAQRLGIRSEFVQIALVCMVALAAAKPGSTPRGWFASHSKKKTAADSFRFSLLSFRYPGSDIDALHNLSFNIEPGQVIELAGSNGSGKTTALRLISGSLNGVAAGQIYQDEYDITTDRIWRTREFAYVDQDARRGVVGSLTTQENLALTAMGGCTRFWRRALRPQIREYVDRVVERGNLGPAQLDQAARLLSGGQRQVLNLLTLLARKKRPKLILADEPTNNLDSVNAKRCGEILSSLHREKIPIIFVSHVPIDGLQPDIRVKLEPDDQVLAKDVLTVTLATPPAGSADAAADHPDPPSRLSAQ